MHKIAADSALEGCGGVLGATDNDNATANARNRTVILPVGKRFDQQRDGNARASAADQTVVLYAIRVMDYASALPERICVTKIVPRIANPAHSG